MKSLSFLSFSLQFPKSKHRVRILREKELHELRKKLCNEKNKHELRGKLIETERHLSRSLY